MCYECEKDPDYMKRMDDFVERITKDLGSKRGPKLYGEPRVQSFVYGDDGWVEWADEVYDRSQLPKDNDFQLAAYDKSVEAVELLLRKHDDYGPNNIAMSPGGPLNGLTVRLWDKVARLAHLLQTGATPENESLYDTFMDISNYGLIGMLVLDGEWPDPDLGSKQ